MQLSTVKQNSCSVVGEVSKPTGIGLDELDGTIEALSAGVADSVVAIAQQSFLMAPEHLDDLLDWLQSAAYGVVRPSFEESLCRPLEVVTPELSEVLLDAPGPAGLKVELVQGPKGNSLSAAAIGILSQPRPLAARQWRVKNHGKIDEEPKMELRWMGILKFAVTPMCEA